MAMAPADVLFPSETDTAGNVVLEAQACGLPVIVTSAGGPKENMRHGETVRVRAEGRARRRARLAELLRDAGCGRRGSGRAPVCPARPWAASLEPVYELYRRTALRRRRQSAACRPERCTRARRERRPHDSPDAVPGEVLFHIAHPVRHLVSNGTGSRRSLSALRGR